MRRMSQLNGLLRATWNRNIISFYSNKKITFIRDTCRKISTGKKSSDTAVVKEEVATAETTTPEKNWLSYGFHNKDKAHDRNAMHSITFFSVTVCMIFGGFFFTYVPDLQLRDWAQREAYLELRHREQNGLPLIDANYVDPSKVDLATDEELGDTEIII